MWRAVFVGVLFYVCGVNAAVAEDVCVSIPNGIMCGPVVPNPGVAIRPPPSPSQFPTQDERSDVRPDQRSEDHRDHRRGERRDGQREKRRDGQIDGRRFDYRFRRGEGPRYDSELRRERIDDRQHNPRYREGSFEREQRFDGGDRYRQRFQGPDERRFVSRRDIERRGQRDGGRQFEDRYRYGHRTFQRRFERPVPRHDGRYHDRSWD
jgi:hypothetical protein